MPNDQISPPSHQWTNGLKLPEASNADIFMGIVVFVDGEAPRRETPNNYLMVISFFPTTRIRQRSSAVRTLSAPDMV